MNKYYFLLCSLPSIRIGQKPEITFDELKKYLEWNLSKKDKAILYCFRQYIDIKNLRRVWLNKPIDLRGNLDEKTIKEVSLIEEHFPDFVFTFLKKFEKIEARIKNFSLLEAEFFQYQLQNHVSDFLSFFLSFERETKLILTALRTKELQRDLNKELKGEDRKDFLVQYILAQKDLESFEPPKKHEKLKALFLKNSEPRDLYKSFLEYCCENYYEFGEKKTFTIDHILSFIAMLFLVEDYFYLDKEKGKYILDSLL